MRENDMKLRKVISGGQTGADRTGLECAKALGLETGGTAPDSWRTDEGHDPTLADFGWCDVCTDWRGIITTGSELDRCPACADWRWKRSRQS